MYHRSIRPARAARPLLFRRSFFLSDRDFRAIGATTFLISAIGVKVGSVFGLRYKKRAELAGGAILCLLGVKILLEHLGVL